MVRKTSRRFGNYSKQNDEEQSNEQTQQGQSANEYDNTSAIADMAQGFIQAQAKMSNTITNNNNLEIALLLQKCNSQLEEIRRSAQGNATASQNKQGLAGQVTSQQSPGKTTPPEENKQQSTNITTQDLQKLLATLGQNNTGNHTASTQSQDSSSTIQDSTTQQSSGGSNQQNMMAVQTVSQVLAQAQYELAQELENSLKKLKQVISESEKIANNISNLLGEETTKKS